MLKTVSDARIRLTLLMNYLDGLATLFRQTQFAESLRIHERAETGLADRRFAERFGS
jgi:hypothetical protein